MKISKNSIIDLASKGYLTLQVPNVFIGGPPNDIFDAPDSWFCELKSDGTPCVGKQKGFLYLTEEGFRANYEDIKDAFETALINGALDRTNGVGWPAFVKYAQDHFAKVKNKKARLIKKKKEEIEQLINMDV